MPPRMIAGGRGTPLGMGGKPWRVPTRTFKNPYCLRKFKDWLHQTKKNTGRSISNHDEQKKKQTGGKLIFLKGCLKNEGLGKQIRSDGE